MLKNSLKQLKGFFLLLFVGFVLNTNAVAFSIIEGNNNVQQAYAIGSWEYHDSIIGKLNSNENEAYFTFMAPSNTDRVYVRTWEGLSVEIVDSNGVPLDNHSDDVEFPTTFPYVKVDADSNYQTFYVRINRTSATGDVYYSVNINNRIKTGFITSEFLGSAYNPGGADSSEISMDLTNDDSIPNRAIIKNISTDGHLNKSLGGVLHKLYATSEDTWYTAIVSGIFDIDTTYNIGVKQIWKFKYNFGGTSSSTMTDVEATIQYQYDLTDQY
jgi:hypothetical protein